MLDSMGFSSLYVFFQCKGSVLGHRLRLLRARQGQRGIKRVPPTQHGLKPRTEKSQKALHFGSKRGRFDGICQEKSQRKSAGAPHLGVRLVRALTMP